MVYKKYEYADDVDVLYIDNNPERKKPKWNLPIGNMVIDVASNGKVLGIEIYSASKFLNFSPEHLNNLKIAEVRVMKMRNLITFGIFIGTATEKCNFQLGITKDENKLSQIIP